ncbi:hypothetical protein [Pseudoalteromonas sp. T1lg10]|uniref:hypothetical protein n=1 Tax=Pseudoalteromonas sp. T1lg10 TaxID=2077093 RepID=UPI000CF5F998|nr:hypothetical protein [Pseudoalteromonas sp. T1lg10]
MKSSAKYGLVIIAVIVFLVMLVPLALWSKGLGLGFDGSSETWAHFGSFFGGVVGPVLTSVSILGLVMTVYLQAQNNTHQAQANEQAEASRLKSLGLEMELEKRREQRFKQEAVERDRQNFMLLITPRINEIVALTPQLIQIRSFDDLDICCTWNIEVRLLISSLPQSTSSFSHTQKHILATGLAMIDLQRGKILKAIASLHFESEIEEDTAETLSKQVSELQKMIASALEQVSEGLESM